MSKVNGAKINNLVQRFENLALENKAASFPGMPKPPPVQSRSPTDDLMDLNLSSPQQPKSPKKTLMTSLNRRAHIDPTIHLSSNSWMQAAERYIDQARLASTSNSDDKETAYLTFMQATNIVTEKLPKQRDFATHIRQSNEYKKLKKRVEVEVIPEMEKLASALREQPYREETVQPLSAEQVADMESHFTNTYPEVSTSNEEASIPSAPIKEPTRKLGASMEFVDANSTTCTPSELRDLIDKSKSGRPTILILDIRVHQDYVWGRIDHQYVVNVDPIGLSKGVSSADIESSLVLAGEEQQKWFRRRDEFDLVVYMCQQARSFGDVGNKKEVEAVETLNSAIYHYEYRKALKRAPLFLIGGYDGWVASAGNDRCVWSGEALRAMQSAAEAQVRHTNVVPVTSTLSAGFEQMNPTMNSGGSVFDFFQQRQQQQHQQPVQYNEPRYTPTRTSFTHGTSHMSPISPASSSQYSYSLNLPADPSSAIHSAPKTVFDNPTYGFTGSTINSASEYPNVHVAMKESTPVPKRRRTPPPIPPPTTRLPPKPAAYVQEIANNNNSNTLAVPSKPLPPPPPVLPLPPKPQELSPMMYNHPVAAGSDPSLNGRMHLGSNLRNQQQPPVISPGSSTSFGGQHMPISASSRNSILPDSGSYGATGLKNFGNTCYMNSVIQCLVGTGPFSRYFLQGSWKKDLIRDGHSGRTDITVEFSRLVHNMWRGQYGSLSPIGFRQAVGNYRAQFKGNDQEDAHEFASFLLDTLHESLNRVHPRPPPEREPTASEEKRFKRMKDTHQADEQWGRYVRRDWSIMTSIFQGQIQSRLTCLTCQHTSTIYSTFTELQLPIPTTKQTSKPSALRRKPKKATGGPVSVYECLDGFSESEILDGDERWHCPHCKCKRRASKKLMVARLPLVLIVHLKRFFTSGHFMEKLETDVAFPTRHLDMSGYLMADALKQTRDTTYNLYAVANHFGRTLSSGHYTASVFNGHRGQWNYFDDTRVSVIGENQVATPAAYLLFFVQNQS